MVIQFLLKKTNLADNGDIVVALIDDHEATLKRIRKRPSIALESANPIYETKIYLLIELKYKVDRLTKKILIFLSLYVFVNSLFNT